MKKVAAVLIVLFLLGGLWILLSYLNCRQFDSPPDVPIYPGAILVEEIQGGTGVHPVYEFHFTSAAKPDEIVRFYKDNKAWCRRRTIDAKDAQICSKDIGSSASYSAIIDFESNKARDVFTRYFVKVYWTKCGADGFIEQGIF